MTDYQTEYLRQENEALSKRNKELIDKNNIIQQENSSLKINLNSCKEQNEKLYGFIFSILSIMIIACIVLFCWSLNSNSNFVEIDGEVKYEFQRFKENGNFPDKIIYNKYYIWKDEINHNCIQEIETHYNPDIIDFINTHYIDRNATLSIQYKNYEYKNSKGYCFKNTYSL